MKNILEQYLNYLHEQPLGLPGAVVKKVADRAVGMAKKVVTNPGVRKLGASTLKGMQSQTMGVKDTAVGVLANKGIEAGIDKLSKPRVRQEASYAMNVGRDIAGGIKKAAGTAVGAGAEMLQRQLAGFQKSIALKSGLLAKTPPGTPAYMDLSKEIQMLKNNYNIAKAKAGR